MKTEIGIAITIIGICAFFVLFSTINKQGAHIDQLQQHIADVSLDAMLANSKCDLLLQAGTNASNQINYLTSLDTKQEGEISQLYRDVDELSTTDLKAFKSMSSAILNGHDRIQILEAAQMTVIQTNNWLMSSGTNFNVCTNQNH